MEKNKRKTGWVINKRGIGRKSIGKGEGKTRTEQISIVARNKQK
jgi:hypothetical protein